MIPRVHGDGSARLECPKDCCSTRVARSPSRLAALRAPANGVTGSPCKVELSVVAVGTGECVDRTYRVPDD